MRLTKVTHKQTGQSYWFGVKQSWGHLYYSVDGDSWFRTKTETYRDAEKRGILPEPTIPTHLGSRCATNGTLEVA